MKLDKLSMQFSTQETESAGDILEAYERLIIDAMREDHTLFTTAEGIESLWERSEPLLAEPPAGQAVRAGLLGAQRHPSAGRSARLAAALRARLAGQENLAIRNVLDQDVARASKVELATLTSEAKAFVSTETR